MPLRNSNKLKGAQMGRTAVSAIQAARMGREFGLAPLEWARDAGGYALLDGGRSIVPKTRNWVPYSLGADVEAHAKWRRGGRKSHPPGSAAHLDLSRRWHLRSELALPDKDVTVPPDASGVAWEALARSAIELSPEEIALAMTNKYGFLGGEGRGARAESEPTAYVVEQLARLWDLSTEASFILFDEGHSTGDAAPAARAAAASKAFNNHPSPLALDLRIEGDRLVAVPRTLIDWVWVQVALDIAHGTRYRGCKVCGTPIPVSAEDRRTERAETCSNACKQKLWRRKEGDRLQDAMIGGGSTGKRTSRGQT